ncbi:kinase domain-containing protein [Aspergillus crustosus]
MSARQQFPDVHWIWKGGISFVYEREQFQKEVQIYKTFSRHPPCPSIVQCFLYTENGIFLEYMRDVTLYSRIANNHIRDQETHLVTRVEKLEPLPLRKQWMNDLAQAVAFLESLNLAHGDLRPENILLNQNQLKLSDFDSTAEIGSGFEACMAPYGRLLNGTEHDQEQDQGRRGSSGFLGSRTEQFALGSLYYLINYGFEHGPKTVDLLQNMEFPKLDGDPVIDEIISKCWHNKYATIRELAAHTHTLLPGSVNQTDTREAEEAHSESPDGYSGGIGQHGSVEGFSQKRRFCENLDERGLLYLLSSGDPE